MSDERAAGTIYDLGYERYDGPRLGRANAIRTLVGFSLRTAFGIGRGGRAKAIPLIVLALVFIPVFTQVAIALALNRPDTISYARHLDSIVWFLALFAAAQAPELVVTDRQQRVLSLYLSRPLGGSDYIFAKLGAFVCALLILTLAPQLVLFLGKVFLGDTPWPAFVAEWKRLGPMVGATVLASIYIGTVGLALAAFTSRRAYGSAAVMAFFLLLPAASAIARRIAEGDTRRYMELGSPVSVLHGLTNWLFGASPDVMTMMFRPRRRPPPPPPDPLDGELYLYAVLITCAVALVALLLRYRRTEV